MGKLTVLILCVRLYIREPARVRVRASRQLGGFLSVLRARGIVRAAQFGCARI